MAVAQSTDPAAEVAVVRTMYAGHDGHASCPGIAEVAAEVGEPVTYCYSLTNPATSVLERIGFIDVATGADSSFMPVVVGAVPVAANSTVTWAFETLTVRLLAGPAPTPTAILTATPATSTPVPTSTPRPTTAAVLTATAVPADPTAVPAAAPPSAPAPPVGANDSSILDTARTSTTGSINVGLSTGSETEESATVHTDPGTVVDVALSTAMIEVLAQSKTVSASDHTTMVPIAPSSGWRLGNTTAAMVLSVLIAVSAGLVAGVAFWRFVRYLQQRRSAFYWYERLAVMDDPTLA